MEGSFMMRKWLPTVLAVLLIGTFTAGVATAVSPSRSGARACESSKGVLALLSKKSKCPAHDRKVTLGATGPRGLRGLPGDKGNSGAQGPGALLTEAESFTAGQDVQGQAIPLPGTDLTARVDCRPQVGSEAVLNFLGVSASDTIFFHGTAQVVESASGAALDDNSSGGQAFSNGTNLISSEDSGSVSTATPSLVLLETDANSDSVYFDLLVNVGSTNTAPNPSFTINGWLFESTSHCQADAQVTPATAPTS
jgi:hypothetical protein